MNVRSTSPQLQALKRDDKKNETSKIARDKKRIERDGGVVYKAQTAQ